MKYYIEFELKEKRCIGSDYDCPLLTDDGCCQLQRDDYGFAKKFEIFTQQLKNCPLKEVSE